MTWADSFHIGQNIVFEEHMRLVVNLFKHPFLSTPSSDFTRMVDSCSALGLHSWCMRRGACILAPATLQGTCTAYLCRSGCTGSCTSRCRPPTSGPSHSDAERTCRCLRTAPSAASSSCSTSSASAARRRSSTLGTSASRALRAATTSRYGWKLGPGPRSVYSDSSD